MTNPAARTAVRRGRIVAVLGVLALLAAVVAWWLTLEPGATSSSPSPVTTSPPSTGTDPPAVDAARAQQFTDALASGSEAELREVVVIPEDQPLEPGAAAEVAALSPITFDPASFVDAGDGTATITATAGTPSQTWTATLLAVDGAWLLTLTTPG